MKILYVCHRLPFPPTRGGKIRPFNMIKHLGRAHEVTVASLARSQREAADGVELGAFCQKQIIEHVRNWMAVLRMMARLPTRHPASVGYFYSPRLARRIREELATTSYDLIFAHCSSVAPYVARTPQIPKILDFGDMDSQKWLAYGQRKSFPVALGYTLEAFKLRRAEMELARDFDCCTCTTPAELKILEELGTAKRSAWFPNGVDTEYFKPTSEPYDPNMLCFLGRMDYYPNQQCMLEFCAKTLPLVRARRPATKLLIVGADPSRKVRKLAAIPGVTVTGTVPEVLPYARRAALSIAPLSIARGTPNKILESMAMGVPTVCSALAAGGVNAVPGEHLLTASTPREYADAIVRLLDKPSERQRVALAGRARVLSHHSWASSMSTLDDIIAECLATGHARRRIRSVA